MIHCYSVSRVFSPKTLRVLNTYDVKLLIISNITLKSIRLGAPIPTGFYVKKRDIIKYALKE